VENHKKWIEWINLECGGLEYKGRIYKKEVLNHEVQLMTCIINTMDYNRLAHEHEIRDANDRKERREAAKVLVDMSRGGEERNGESRQVMMVKTTMTIATRRLSLWL
jgi:hypothetical protein